MLMLLPCEVERCKIMSKGVLMDCREDEDLTDLLGVRVRLAAKPLF
jgi:hypothetical protein